MSFSTFRFFWAAKVSASPFRCGVLSESSFWTTFKFFGFNQPSLVNSDVLWLGNVSPEIDSDNVS